MTKKVFLIASGSIAVTAIAICAAFFFIQPKSGLAIEANATIGAMPGVDEDARRNQLQEMLDKSKIAFSMNTSPVLSQDDEINLLLENPINNQKLLTAEIILEETGDSIYLSNALVPGSYLENVKLNKPLSPGSHNAVVYLTAFDQETQEIIGQTGAEITIIAT